MEASRPGFLEGMRGPDGRDTFRWFWEHPITLARERGSPTEVLIQRSDTFQRRNLHTELGGSALWVFDCRRGSLVDDDLDPWADAEYGQVVDLIWP